jgi:hypothetical protein
MSIAAVIFSKDRPAQLELLLRSLSEQVAEWRQFAISVLYKSSEPEFDTGYDIVKKAFPSVFFQPEDATRTFKGHVQTLIEREEREFFHFLVDDLVCIRGYSTSDTPFQLLRTRPDIAAVALRMSPLINFSQPLNLRTPPPPHRDNVWTWAPNSLWMERIRRLFGVHPATGDWRLQMNADGNVVRYPEFLTHFKAVPEIRGLNVLEGVLLEHPMPAPCLTCYPESRLINLALNRVDPYSHYPFGGHSAREFNQRYLTGGRLSYEKLVGLQHNACHIVVDPEWCVQMPLTAHRQQL